MPVNMNGGCEGDATETRKKLKSGETIRRFFCDMMVVKELLFLVGFRSEVPLGFCLLPCYPFTQQQFKNALVRVISKAKQKCGVNLPQGVNI